jgi:septum formation protein
MPIAAQLWLATAPLVLASSSATRRSLLEAAGLAVETLVPDIDERAVERRLLAGGLASARIADGLAIAKALDVSVRYPGRWVVAADQTLTFEGELFHKPADRAAARAQLLALAGRTHLLRSAYAVACNGTIRAEGADEARLTIRSVSESFVDRLLTHLGESVTTSVGGYKVEGPGIHLFETIDGDHTTILGLPLLPLFADLRRLGVLAS